MRKTVAITALVGGLTILVAGCDFESRGGVKPIDPSAIAGNVSVTPVLLGTWSSKTTAVSAGSSSFPTASSCTQLKWTITEQTGATYTNTFRATCAGRVVLDGTATGTLTGNVLNISATGTASIPVTASCSFSLTGTATLVDDAIQVSYAGASCFGPIEGNEVLAKS